MSGEGESGEKVRLTWKDYLALLIALVQTLALPLIVLVLILVGLLLLFGAIR